MRTSQLKACYKNSKFWRGAYIAAYKIGDNSDEVSKIPVKITKFEREIYFCRTIFCEIPLDATINPHSKQIAQLIDSTRESQIDNR